MKLNVNERLVLLRTIPEKGNFETMTTIENLKKVLNLSEQEVLDYEFKQHSDQITWNKKGLTGVEIKIGELGMSIITKELEKLDEDASLSSNHFQLFKRIKDEKEKTKPKK